MTEFIVLMTGLVSWGWFILGVSILVTFVFRGGGTTNSREFLSRVTLGILSSLLIVQKIIVFFTLGV